MGRMNLRAMAAVAVLLACAAPGGVLAQRTWVGVKYGIGIRATHGRDVDGREIRDAGLLTGEFGALLAHYPHELVAIQFEILWVGKGTMWPFGEFDPNAAGPQPLRLHLGYLDLPLLVRLKAPIEILNRRSGSVATPYVLTGPALGVLLGCKFETGVSHTPEGPKDEFTDCDDPSIGFETMPLHLGWMFGGGVEWQLVGGPRTLVEFVFNRGLTRFNSSDPRFPGLAMKNKTWMFTAGIIFRLGGG